MTDPKFERAGEILVEKLAEPIEEELKKDIERDTGESPDRNTVERIKSLVGDHLEREAGETVDRLSARVKDRVYREVSRKFKKDLRKEEERVRERVMFLRFNRNFRFQHMVLFVSCIILILTGLPLKFPEFEPLAGLIGLMGGIENSTLLHRIGAGMLIFVAVYHTFWIVMSRRGRKDFMLLIPKPRDVFDFFNMIKFFTGKSEDKPKFGRFSYIEKFDYWAVYWGCVIMIGSGLVLWFQDIALRFMPKYLMDISREMHSDEALLATLAIVVWHFYNVHFNPHKFPGSMTWWHGKISEEEMLDEHPLEYEELKKGSEGEGS